MLQPGRHSDHCDMSILLEHSDMFLMTLTLTLTLPDGLLTLCSSDLVDREG